MDEKQEATVMAESGISAAEIAKELGVSVATVYNWLETSNTIQQQKQERDAGVVTAYQENWPVWRICKTFSISQGTLYSVLHKHDVPMRRRHGDHDAVDGQIVQMYKQDTKLSDIMHATGHSLGYIYQVLDRNNIPRRRPSPTQTTSPSTEPVRIKPKTDRTGPI